MHNYLKIKNNNELTIEFVQSELDKLNGYKLQLENIINALGEKDNSDFKADIKRLLEIFTYNGIGSDTFGIIQLVQAVLDDLKAKQNVSQTTGGNRKFKTVRRKTVRRKTVRRKTMRRKTMRRKTVRRKTEKSKSKNITRK